MQPKVNRRSMIDSEQQYVSRAAYKLASVSQALELDFNAKRVLDVGSSTGGFSDYALQHGASIVIAVEKGTDQLNPRLKLDGRLKLYEKTDIRDFKLVQPVDIVLIDVSFISLRDILPSIKRLSSPQTLIIAMVKPQFETQRADDKHNGVVKNERIRRQILLSFEIWAKEYFVIHVKADSAIKGDKGNGERFYALKHGK